ncbi:MAG TPA: nucleotidyltransferase family protein [Herpetosiphonaceae bacterium]
MFNQPGLPEMTAQDAIDVLLLFEQHGITVWVDGGWAVDALLGEQTRRHADLDIALSHHDVQKLRALLEARGYRDVPRDDTRECNFVLGDDHGREVDVHTFIFDARGNNIFGCAYPAESLTGTGSIDGYPVRCIAPQWLVSFHTGYPLDADDYHDVRALCARFNLEIPREYEPFMNEDGQ